MSRIKLFEPTGFPCRLLYDGYGINKEHFDDRDKFSSFNLNQRPDHYKNFFYLYF